MRLFSPPSPADDVGIVIARIDISIIVHVLSSEHYRETAIRPESPSIFSPPPPSLSRVQIMARASKSNWRIIITANCYKLTKKNRGPRGGRREKEIRQLDTAIRSSFTRMPNEPRSRVVDYEIELISKIRKWNKSIWKPFQEKIFRFIRRIIREKETRFDRKIWRYF